MAQNLRLLTGSYFKIKLAIPSLEKIMSFRTKFWKRNGILQETLEDIMTCKTEKYQEKEIKLYGNVAYRVYLKQKRYLQ